MVQLCCEPSLALEKLAVLDASLMQDSSSSANQDQWPSASMTLTRESLGITEEISNADQPDDSSFKPPEESQIPEIVPSNTGCVTALSLGMEKEDNIPRAFLNNEAEVLSGHRDSAVTMSPDSLESACLEQSREEDMSESIASTVPVCQEEDTQPKGNESQGVEQTPVENHGGSLEKSPLVMGDSRSDLLSLPFQGAEVLLDNVVPLPGEDHFSSEADAVVVEMTKGAVLVVQVHESFTNYDNATGLPLIQMWNLMRCVMSVSRTLVERGFAQWLDY
nr:PREDICTED: uncharacterized protein LOC104642133 [Balearica regulorum gibbericeps]